MTPWKQGGSSRGDISIDEGRARVRGQAMTDTGVTAENIIGRIERLPPSRWHIKMRAIVGSATFFDSFDSLSIAFVAPALIGQWHLRPTDIGFLISAGSIGSVIGGIGFGWAAERYGRLRTLVWTVLLLALTSLACAAAWNFWSLFILRVLAGLGLGGELPVAIAYINEFAKAERRGWFVLIYESVYAVGIVAVSLSAVWIVPHLGWQWMFIIGAVPALVVIPLRRGMPESPRWLASRGRTQEADVVLRRIENEVSDGGRIPLPEPRPIAAVSTARGTWRDLFGGVYLKRTLMVWAATFIATFVGFGVTLWLPSIYKTVFKLPDQQSLLLSVLSNVMILLAVFTCSFVIDRTGRRPWYTFAFLGTAVPLFAIYALGTNITVTSMLIWATVASYFFPQLQLGMTLYPAELYPTRMRALGAGIAGTWTRLGLVFGPPVIGYVLQNGGLGADFLMLGSAAILGAVIMLIFGVETKKRLLEEVSP
jgi:putative MFS transporter